MPTQAPPLTNQPEPLSYGAPKPFINDLSPEQRDKMYAKLGDMNISPANIGTTNQKSLLEATFTEEELAQMPYYANVSKRDEDLDYLGTNLQEGGNLPKPSASMMRPLEEAMRTKEGFEDESIGRSELFDQAGIDPYASLSYALAERGKEMQSKYDSFADIMGQVGESLSDSYSAALDSYDRLQTQYNEEVGRIDSITKDLRDHEQALELIKANEEASRRLKLLGNSLLGPSSLPADAEVPDWLTGAIEMYGNNEISEAEVKSRIGANTTSKEYDAYLKMFYDLIEQGKDTTLKGVPVMGNTLDKLGIVKKEPSPREKRMALEEGGDLDSYFE